MCLEPSERRWGQMRSEGSRTQRGLEGHSEAAHCAGSRGCVAGEGSLFPVCVGLLFQNKAVTWRTSPSLLAWD